MPRRFARRRFLQVSAGAAAAAVAYGVLGVPGVRSRSEPSARRVLTKEFNLGPAELAEGSRAGLATSSEGLKVESGRHAGHVLSPVLKSDILFDYVGLFWSGLYPEDSSLAFWVRTSTDGRSWSPWETVHVEMPPGPRAQHDTYGALVWTDRANYVQFLGEMQGAGKKPELHRVGLTLLNLYDGPVLEAASVPGDGGFASSALAAEADSDLEANATLAAASGKPITFKREDWGADESLRFSGSQEIWPRSYVPTKKLIVHHTVTGNGYATVAQAKAQVRAIYTYHARSLGWGDIGYNSLIDRFGNSYEGRRGRSGPGYDGPGGREILSEDIVAGHALAYNYGSSGIALLGTFCTPSECSGGSPPSAMISRLKDVLEWECRKHGINPKTNSDFLFHSGSWHRDLRNLVGHRDVSGTTCPGGNVYALLPTLRSDVAARLGSAGPTVNITSSPPQTTVSNGKADYAWAGSGGVPPLEFSYYLEGWSLSAAGIRYRSGYTSEKSPAWSLWTQDTGVHLSFQSKGLYTFHIRARDVNGRISIFQDNRTFLGTTQVTPGFSPAVWRPSTGTWYVKGRPSVEWGLPDDVPVPGDYNGDGKIDLAVWRPSDGNWHIPGRSPVQWGRPGDMPVPGDYNGDGKTDMTVWRPSNGSWYVRGRTPLRWGRPGDIPVAGDYNGDGKVDLAVWRPSNRSWYVRGRTPVQWGLPGDIPVPGDYNGDGKTDMTVWRSSNGTWYVRGRTPVQWGLPGDIPVPGDYNGDGKTDLAVWRPSNGTWYIRGRTPVQWGQPGDIPVPGDYNGDGKTDLAVWRPSNGLWYVRGRALTQWGSPGDIPVPGDYNGDGKTDLAVWRPSNGIWYVRGLAKVQWGLPGLPVR